MLHAISVAKPETKCSPAAFLNSLIYRVLSLPLARVLVQHESTVSLSQVYGAIRSSAAKSSNGGVGPYGQPQQPTRIESARSALTGPASSSSMIGANSGLSYDQLSALFQSK